METASSTQPVQHSRFNTASSTQVDADLQIAVLVLARGAPFAPEVRGSGFPGALQGLRGGDRARAPLPRQPRRYGLRQADEHPLGLRRILVGRQANEERAAAKRQALTIAPARIADLHGAASGGRPTR